MAGSLDDYVTQVVTNPLFVLIIDEDGIAEIRTALSPPEVAEILRGVYEEFTTTNFSDMI